MRDSPARPFASHSCTPSGTFFNLLVMQTLYLAIFVRNPLSMSNSLKWPRSCLVWDAARQGARSPQGAPLGTGRRTGRGEG